MSGGRHSWAAVVAAVMLLLMCSSAMAQAPQVFDRNKPVYMQADQLGYDRNQAIVVAKGNVEVVQGMTRLIAERITYYQNYNIVRADGNVQVMDSAKGETYYADRVQLKDDLKEGVIQQFRVRMADNSQFAAIEARKTSPTTTELTKAVYSPCKICEGKSPLWQMKAGKVTIDEQEQEVRYKDLYLEVYGIPVAYTPYFFHPTPGADMKSGFLTPSYSQKTNLGTVIHAPYYVNISPSQDATITPILTSQEGPVLDTEYRLMTDNGEYEAHGSITYPQKRDDTGAKLSDNELRGHIMAKGQHRFSEHWSTGFDVQRASDDTYLRKYDYGNYNSLNSRLYAEGVYGRSYALMEAMAFQGLRVDDDPAHEPFLLPLMEGRYESGPGWNGSRFFSSASTQVLLRDEGPSVNRLSLTGGWKLPYVTSGGQLFDLQTSLRNDLYNISNVTLASGQTVDADEARLIPLSSLKWRYPLLKMVGDASLTLEPTMMAVATSSGNNPETITPEDSRSIEFSDSQLFDPDPMPGIDAVINGSRVAYGMRGEWAWQGGQSLGFLFGQQYLAESDSIFPYTTDPGAHFSDYVGKVALDYAPVMLAYHFRLDQEDGSANSNGISTGLHYDSFDWQLHYVSLQDDPYLQDRKELLSSMAIALSDSWSINGSARRDVLDDRMLYAGAGLIYQNECLTLLTSFKRQFVRDRDIEPDTSLTVRVSLKNLN